MLIQLKQTEIEAALKDYVVKQGFSLRGKDVSIAFTAGRSGGGLTADLDISDGEAIPGFTDSVDETAAIPAGPIPRVLNAVKEVKAMGDEPAFDADTPPTRAAIPSPKTKVSKPDFVPEPAVNVGIEGAPEPEVEIEAPAPVKTTSLFGG